MGATDEKILHEIQNLFSRFENQVLQKVDQRITAALPSNEPAQAHLSRGPGRTKIGSDPIKPIDRMAPVPSLPTAQVAQRMREIVESPGAPTVERKPLGRPRIPRVELPTPIERPLEESPELSMRDRVREALLQEALDLNGLARALDMPATSIAPILVTLRKEFRIYNVGLGEDPTWTWRIGDDTDNPTLRALIQRLIMRIPMTTHELAQATGARMSRAEGEIVHLRRVPPDGYEIVDMNKGITRTGRWFLIPKNLSNAGLAPKRKPKKR